jgi:L-threonylcarbamoyladenylate synthase
MCPPSESSPDRRIVVDPAICTEADLAPAVRWLRAGGIVLFPTDTFYGLAADPTSARAIEALFDVKGRDPRTAVPLIAASLADVTRVFGPLGGSSARLADVFWPGPLSIVLDAPATVAAAVHGGKGTVAVRVPDDGVARLLAHAHGGLLTATSANRSGSAPAARVVDVDDVARDRRVLVIDAGPTPGGVPSTIVDARNGPPVLVRAGAIAWERVLELLDA